MAFDDHIGRTGIRTTALASEDPAPRTEISEAAAEPGELGYGTFRACG